MKIDEAALHRKAYQLSETYDISYDLARLKLMQMSPKKLYDLGLVESGGWRPGNTKKSLEKRKKERRKKKR